MWHWSTLFLRFQLPRVKYGILVELYTFCHKLFKWICFIGKVHWKKAITVSKKTSIYLSYSEEFRIWHQGIIQVSIGSLEIRLWSPKRAANYCHMWMWFCNLDTYPLGFGLIALVFYFSLTVRKAIRQGRHWSVPTWYRFGQVAES